jgi:hypothetical protein
MHMRTTLNLNNEIMDKAARLTGIKEKTSLIHKGLEALIAMEARKRLANLGGTEPRLHLAPRRRSA